MTTEYSGKATESPARRDWVAALLLRQPDRFMPRLAAALARWQSLSRGFRRRFTRKVAATAAGAALVLAMAGSPLLVPRVHAATIDVDDGIVIVADDGFCSLREAMLNARIDSQVFATAGECAAGSGVDTINLPVDGDFLIEDGAFPLGFGNFGLSTGSEDVIIEGNGSTIRRDPLDTDDFGILVSYGNELTLKDVTISGGSGYLGGGIFTYYGELNLIDSTVKDNTTDLFGGGLGGYYAAMRIAGSTISGNSSNYYAGAIATFGGTLDIVNSTISGNEAHDIGAISLGLFFGGSSTVTTITNSTITDNTAIRYIGGIGQFLTSDLTISRSIVSGNRAGVLKGVEFYNTDYATVTASHYNVWGHAGLTNDQALYGFANSGSDANATSDGANIPLGDILETTLADNGGPTATHNLVLGSPALDFAPDDACEDEPVFGRDQRGYARPIDVAGQGNEGANTCDAGAVEYAPIDDTAVFMSAKTAGTTADNVSFGSEDILMWDGSGWSKWFDGDADANLNPVKTYHNIDAFWIPDPSGEEVFLSFTRNQRPVPGINGIIDAMDIVRWNGSAFSLLFDGQDVGLQNLTAENIDALHVLPGSEWPGSPASCLHYLLISTKGAGNVPAGGGGTLKFSGEDVLGFCLTQAGADTAGLWTMVLDGSTVGMNKNSTESISVSDDGQTLHLTTTAKFTVNGVLMGNKSMVFAYDLGTQTFSGPIFIAPAEGLPKDVDGLQVN